MECYTNSKSRQVSGDISRRLKAGFFSGIIIYRVDRARQAVRILRFWHGARGKRPLR